MIAARPSQWSALFETALSIIAQAVAATYGFDWTFGGGTALMVQIDHRESHDVDLFLTDPQLLPFLNPATQAYSLDRQPDGYDGDGSRVLKLMFDRLGEIDFICCQPITGRPAEIRHVLGRPVHLETPAEVVAKKVFYRGGRLQPRDMFDIAAVAQRCGEAYVIDALRACGAERCAAASSAADAMDPAFAIAVMDQLIVREHARHLPPVARSVTLSMLRAARGS